MGSLDLPHEPEESGPPEHRLEPREVPEPEPDERGRVYEATRAYVEEDGPEPQDSQERSGYWAEVPRLMHQWKEHDERWAAERQSRAGFEQPTDLSMERDAARDAIDCLREGEPPISADLQTVERENAYGGRLEGFDFRLKGDDRLTEKIAHGLAMTGPDATPDEIVRQIPDAIRYTFCLNAESYTRGYYDIKERLETLGHEMYQSKNSWEGAEYKGINTRWVTRDGVRFEVQFHTPESFHAKQQVTHRAYERLRDPLTSDAERGELEAFQRKVASRIEIPDEATGIPDFKKEGF